MTGQGAWAGMVPALLGGSFAAGRIGSVFASVVMATLLLDAVALWLARRALADQTSAGSGPATLPGRPWWSPPLPPPSRPSPWS